MSQYSSLIIVFGGAALLSFCGAWFLTTVIRDVNALISDWEEE